MELDADAQEPEVSPYFAGTKILNFAALFGQPETALQLPPPLPARKQPQGEAPRSTSPLSSCQHAGLQGQQPLRPALSPSQLNL